jgi:hypothetical protein
MSKRRFTEEEIEILSKNENVSKCSEKSITYGKDFKVQAIKQYQEGRTSRDIFIAAGFDPCVIGKDIPNGCIKRWKINYRTKGENCFTEETRGKGGGRPKKIRDKSDADKIKRLEAENAYLKAENDFFKQLRAKRAERYSGRNTNTK